jgi:hypothetical protein
VTALLLSMLLGPVWNGTSPWCRVDTWGNGQCYWLTRDACELGKPEQYTCILNQRER